MIRIIMNSAASTAIGVGGGVLILFFLMDLLPHVGKCNCYRPLYRLTWVVVGLFFIWLFGFIHLHST